MMKEKEFNEEWNYWISKDEKDLVMKTNFRKIFDQLKESVKDKLPPEFFFITSETDRTAYLLRWLRARDMNLEKAEDMLLKNLIWRKDNRLDDALHLAADPHILDLCQWNCFGPDWKGRPVLACRMNQWDFRKFTSVEYAEKFDFWVKQYFEAITTEIKINNENRKLNQAPVTQLISVYDMKDFAYGQMLNLTAMKKLFEMGSVYEAYYPEILYKVIVLNCPWFYSMLVNLAKPFISSKTLSKIDAYPDLNSWKKDIGKYMDPAYMPVQYGGTNRDPLPPPEQLKYFNDMEMNQNEEHLYIK